MIRNYDDESGMRGKLNGWWKTRERKKGKNENKRNKNINSR